MREQLILLLNFTVSLFAVVSMMSVGLAHSLRDILIPLKNRRLILSALMSNFLLIPLMAYGISMILNLDEPYRIGLYLLATASGAPFLVKLVVVAKADLAASTAILSLLLVMTVIYMPVVVPLILPGVAVSSGRIALSLIWTMLVPLGIGLFICGQRPGWSKHLQSITAKVSTFALVGIVLLTVSIHYQVIREILGEGVILAAVLLTLGSFLIGYLSGERKGTLRTVMGLASSQRNIAAAIVVASQDFEDPDIIVMVIVTSLIGLFLLFPVAWFLGRKNISASSLKVKHHGPVRTTH